MKNLLVSLFLFTVCVPVFAQDTSKMVNARLDAEKASAEAKAKAAEKAEEAEAAKKEKRYREKLDAFNRKHQQETEDVRLRMDILKREILREQQQRAFQDKHLLLKEKLVKALKLGGPGLFLAKFAENPVKILIESKKKAFMVTTYGGRVGKFLVSGPNRLRYYSLCYNDQNADFHLRLHYDPYVLIAYGARDMVISGVYNVDTGKWKVKFRGYLDYDHVRGCKWIYKNKILRKNWWYYLIGVDDIRAYHYIY